MSGRATHWLVYGMLAASILSTSRADDTGQTFQGVKTLEFVSTSRDLTSQIQTYCLQGERLSKVLNVTFTTSGTSPKVNAAPDLDHNCIVVTATFQASQVCTQVPQVTFKGGGILRIPQTEWRDVCNAIPSALSATVTYEFQK
jgi:hypothetical protein